MAIGVRGGASHFRVAGGQAADDQDPYRAVEQFRVDGAGQRPFSHDSSLSWLEVSQAPGKRQARGSCCTENALLQNASSHSWMCSACTLSLASLAFTLLTLALFPV